MRFGLDSKLGYKEVGRVLSHSRATGTAKLLLVAIAHHDGPGGSWPSRDTLAEYGNVDGKNARRAIKKLEEAGELRVHVNSGGSDERPEGHRPNLYELLVSCPPECDGSDHHRMPKTSRRRTEGATAPPQPGGERDPGEGATAPPKLSFQPSPGTIPGSIDQAPWAMAHDRKAPVTAAEKADRRRLARFVTNLPPKAVDVLWGWMRTGHSLSGDPTSPLDRPGATAAKKHRSTTRVPDVTEWQGWFRHHYLTEKQREQMPDWVPLAADDDPWAASA